MRPVAQLALHIVIVFMFVAGAIGCLPQLQASQRAQVDAMVSRCHPPFVHRQLDLDASAGQTMLTRGQLGTRVPRLSQQAQQTAMEIGLLSQPEIGLYTDELELESEFLAIASLRQAFSRRIALAASDVMSTIAGLDCEAARSDHVADAIGETHQDISEQALFAVFASDIFIGIIPGALMLAGQTIAAEANEIFGGVAGIGFGSVGAVLDIDQHFQHPNNFLRELWERPAESRLFPASVWRFLNDPSEEEPYRTVREALLARWQTEGRWDVSQVTPNGRDELPLLLSEGGRYGETLLRIRAEMLRQVGSEVRRLGLAIHRLKYELTQWLDTHPTGEPKGSTAG